MAGYVSPERKAFQTKANIFVICGLGLSLLTRGVLSAARHATATGNVPNVGLSALAFVVAIASLVCWYIGLSAYAQSKGYAKWFGLLGLLSCCGLLILVVLPNKWVDGVASGYGPGDYPRPNG